MAGATAPLDAWTSPLKLRRGRSITESMPRHAAIPDTPPPEVLEAMDTAAQAYDRLAATGRRLHFESDPLTGRVAVQLLDPEGGVVANLRASQVLHLADGRGID